MPNQHCSDEDFYRVWVYIIKVIKSTQQKANEGSPYPKGSFDN